jgi:hypothetical protein
LRILLLQLLLLLQAALLHLLNDLLRRAHWHPRSGPIGWLRRLLRLRFRLRLFSRLIRLLVGVRILVGRRARALIRRRLSFSAAAPAQDNPPWRALALIANHQNVVSGTIKELRKHIASRSGAVSAKNALILIQTLHLGACIRRNVFQYLVEAGV